MFSAVWVCFQWAEVSHSRKCHWENLKWLLEWFLLWALWSGNLRGDYQSWRCTADNTEMRIKLHPALLLVGELYLFHSIRNIGYYYVCFYFFQTAPCCPALTVLPPGPLAFCLCWVTGVGCPTLPGFPGLAFPTQTREFLNLMENLLETSWLLFVLEKLRSQVFVS